MSNDRDPNLMKLRRCKWGVIEKIRYTGGDHYWRLLTEDGMPIYHQYKHQAEAMKKALVHGHMTQDEPHYGRYKVVKLFITYSYRIN